MTLTKENVFYALATPTIILFLIFIVPIPVFCEVDFYDFHVWECEQAHAHNKSYSLCSGFWYEPAPDHIPNPVIWHPSEDPGTIPHGSCLGTSEWKLAFGLYGLVTASLLNSQYAMFATIVLVLVASIFSACIIEKRERETKKK